MEQSQQSKYKKAFRDIKNGFSEIKVLEDLFYLKHLSLEDQVDIDQIYDIYFEEAEKRGVPTNDDTLKRLVDEKQWSNKQESLIKQEEHLIENFNKQKKSLYLKSEINRINADIESAQKRLNDLKNTRAAFFQRTAESYAEERVNDYYILKCLYKDKLLTKHAFEESEFDNIDAETLSLIIKQYGEVYKNINDNTIQYLVLQDFFNLYMPFAENPTEFFGKSVCELTYNQVKLLIYARFFKNVFQQNDKMPQEIKNDPDKIIDYVNANENAKKMMENKNNKENQATSIVGATSEDLEYVGLKAKGQKTLSLADEAKKKGGSLSMEDMMRIFG